MNVSLYQESRIHASGNNNRHNSIFCNNDSNRKYLYQDDQDQIQHTVKN